MLILVSDLHFVDGTAGEHNVPANAFRIFFENISGIIQWHKKQDRKIEEIKIVFLGDIFDLLRTVEWLDPTIKESEKPWGSNEAKIEKNANAIFDKIIHKNQDTFDLLKGTLKGKFDFPVEPERIYIPGNHDRLCNRYKSLRGKVRKNLGIRKKSAPFACYFKDNNYGVFARHGHEFDTYNYEGSPSYRYEDYMMVPIGDPITTELIAKLPWKIMNKPRIKRLPAAEREALKRNLQDIENVRPFSATLEWLVYQVRSSLDLKESIDDAVDETIREFRQIEFVKKWHKKHNKRTDVWDAADKIQYLLCLLDKFKVFSLEKVLPLVERFKRDSVPAHFTAALREASEQKSGIRFIVYGHTHEPKQVPIRVITDENGSVEQVYLNTGTWRAQYHKSLDGLGFIGWKNMTYTVFYKPGERGGDIPAFETWSGTLKTI